MNQENTDQLLAAFLDLVNGLDHGIHEIDSGIKKLRHRIRALKVGWIPENIKWTQAEGRKGAYQRSDDRNNPDFQALLYDLEEHDGTLTKDDYFYWKFQEGNVIGRKKRTETQEEREKGIKVSQSRTREEIERVFPEELRELLHFSRVENGVKIVPRKFLGSDKFSRIAGIVREQGGEYVSAGKESHFMIPTLR